MIKQNLSMVKIKKNMTLTRFFLFLLFSIVGNAQTHRFIYEFKFKEDSTTQNFRKENI